MGYQQVLVYAWVFDGSEQPPQPPLGIWGPNDPRPTPPIVVPPGGNYPQPPGIWGPNDPRPSNPISGIPGLPGYQPPAGGGGAPPHPSHPIYRPDLRPEHPIYFPPGIWGPNDPRPSNPISGVPGAPGYQPPFPVDPGFGNEWFDPRPSHPIAGPPEWGYHPEHPIYNPPPSFPILDPGTLPDHPELPDLNTGKWVYVQQGGLLVQAFVPNPQISITNPIYNPNFPPEENQPGEWVSIYYYDNNYNGLAWAWIPSQPAAVESPPTAEQLPA